MATKQIQTTGQFLVVADCGPDADYAIEPRHRVTLPLPFTPSRRSSTQQLRRLCRLLCLELGGVLHGNCVFGESGSGLPHVWLCDETGQPTLSVSGLLSVREGRATKAGAERLHRRLLPQLTCEQTVRECRIYLCASVHTRAGYDDPVGYGDELTERENEVLDEVDHVFDEYGLGDSDEDDDGTLYVRADGWLVVTASLPFGPGPKATASQLRYAHAVALEELQNAIPDDWELEDECLPEVWVLDGDSRPALYVTGLLDVCEGRLPRKKLASETARAMRDLPSVDLLSGKKARSLGVAALETQTASV